MQKQVWSAGNRFTLRATQIKGGWKLELGQPDQQAEGGVYWQPDTAEVAELSEGLRLHVAFWLTRFKPIGLMPHTAVLLWVDLIQN